MRLWFVWSRAGEVDRSETMSARRRRCVDDQRLRLRVAVADVDVAARSRRHDLQRPPSVAREYINPPPGRPAFPWAHPNPHLTETFISPPAVVRGRSKIALRAILARVDSRRRHFLR